MKTENFNKEERYVAPEMESIQIFPRSVLLDSQCPTENTEPIDDPCPNNNYQW